MTAISSARFPDRFNFTRDVVEAIAAADPRRNALTFVGADGVIDRLTFAEVAVAANRWSALLRARGLYPGDRLLVCVGETPAWPAIVLGGLKAGLVVVPCPEMLRPHELAFRGEHSEAQLVVADRERARHVRRDGRPCGRRGRRGGRGRAPRTVGRTADSRHGVG